MPNTPRWLTGIEIAARYGIKPFELFEFIKQGLQPHDNQGRPIPPPDVNRKRKRLEVLKDNRQEKKAYLASKQLYLKELENPRSAARQWLNKQRLFSGTIGSTARNSGRSLTVEGERKRKEQEIEKLTEEIASVETAILKLEEDLSGTLGDSWSGYRLPTMKTKADEIFLTLKTMCFRVEDLLPFIGSEKTVRRIEDEQHQQYLDGACEIFEQPKEKCQKIRFLHSDDFRSVTKNGVQFSLTPRQAEVIQALFDAHETGTPELSQEHLTQGKRLRDVFRSNADAKAALITEGKRKGLFRLKI